MNPYWGVPSASPTGEDGPSSAGGAAGPPPADVCRLPQSDVWIAEADTWPPLLCFCGNSFDLAAPGNADKTVPVVVGERRGLPW